MKIQVTIDSLNILYWQFISENYTLLAYAENEKFSEIIPTTEGNITLNLDAHEIAVLKFSMTITHCDHFTLDRFTIQNYRIDYKIKIDNSGTRFDRVGKGKTNLNPTLTQP